ncbi:MAG: hypothetical protein HYU71_06310 [Bacteroidetes bacterium]|nr:hypothetical protein [Bacteroidota bacterium]
MFDTAQEYLEYLQQICTKVYDLPFEKDPEFTKLNSQDVVHLSPDQLDGMYQMKFLLNQYLNAILNTVSPDLKEKIESSLAIGFVRNGSFNATCSKSSTGKYAVLIYEGLFILLNKHGKLAHATNNPKIVRFCNRGDIKTLTSDDYIKFMNELFDNYKKYHFPIGALVKLDSKYLSHMVSIMLSELFTICHEIGHFINGDFDEEANFANLADHPFEAFIEDRSHEIEYKADLSAYPIFEKAAFNLFPEMEKNNFVPVLSTFFAIMGTVSNSKSESHPEAFRRMTNILAAYYSEQIALDYLASFESQEKSNEFFSRFVSD